MTIRFVLASASPARRKLLDSAGIPHIAMASDFDEDSVKAEPMLFVQILAKAKAETILAKIDSADGSTHLPGLADNFFVLGCDSVLVLDGEIHGKPRDRSEAVGRWRQMRGRSGELLTGHALIRNDRGQRRTLVKVQRTVVRFAQLEDSEIEAYVDAGEAMKCAGAFALEGRGGLFVEGIEGCHSNVIGLSLPLLRKMMLELGAAPHEFWVSPAEEL
jgi:septum formation protein